MKLKNYFLTLLAAGAIVSCSSDDIEKGGPDQLNDDTILTLEVSDPKGAGSSETQKLTVLVFDNGAYGGTGFTNNNNPLKAFGTSDGMEVIKIPVKGGKIKVLALLNAQWNKIDESFDFSDTGNVPELTLNDILKATSKLADEDIENPTMSSAVISTTINPTKTYNGLGYTNAVLTGRYQDDYYNLTPANDSEVTEKGVKVYRNISLIALKDITVKNIDPAIGSSPRFDKTSEYLINVKKTSELASEAGWGIIEDNTAEFYKKGEWNKKFHVYENRDTDFSTQLIIEGVYSYLPPVLEGNETEEELEALRIKKERTYIITVNEPTGEGRPTTGKDFEDVAEHDYIKRNTEYTINITLNFPSDIPYECLAVEVKAKPWNVVEINEGVE